jgi:uncharacterized protein (DUF302 family)
VSDVTYGRTVVVDGTVEEMIPRVKEALTAQGFGVLTEIDVEATLREKLGVEVAPYVILGACNPVLANRALAAEPEIGLLLPCNVVVRAHEGRVVVSALDPQMMSDVTGHPALPPIADEATAALDAALAAVATG